MTQTVRMLVLDVDGVLTDGKLWYLPDGQELKCFHVHDGLGIKLLQKAGLEVAVISARGGLAVETRCKELGISHCWFYESNKLSALKSLSQKTGISYEHMAYMGDDLADLEPLNTVGYPMTVANAVDAIKAVACYQTSRSGGHGAVREAAEHLLNQTQTATSS